ncbi:unnamed protein product, partial [Didymodactylos carnosus]
LNHLAKSSLLCLHIRTYSNPSNPRDPMVPDRLHTAEDMCKYIGTNSTTTILEKNKLQIFVASDSAKAVSTILQYFPNQSLSVPGPIVHIDRPSGKANVCDGFSKVIIDFYLLGECHTSLLTSSGFSAMANRRRLKPYENLFMYQSNKRKIIRCDDSLKETKWESINSTQYIYCTEQGKVISFKHW